MCMEAWTHRLNSSNRIISTLNSIGEVLKGFIPNTRRSNAREERQEYDPHYSEPFCKSYPQITSFASTYILFCGARPAVMTVCNTVHWTRAEARTHTDTQMKSDSVWRQWEVLVGMNYLKVKRLQLILTENTGHTFYWRNMEESQILCWHLLVISLNYNTTESPHIIDTSVAAVLLSVLALTVASLHSQQLRLSLVGRTLFPQVVFLQVSLEWNSAAVTPTAIWNVNTSGWKRRIFHNTASISKAKPGAGIS